MQKKILAASGLLVLLLPLVVFGWVVNPEQWNTYYRNWNADGNGYLDKTEFTNGFNQSGIFKTLDNNGDGKLGTNEFYTLSYQIFSSWDVNSDGSLDSTEFLSTKLTTGGDAIQWDGDRDGTLTRGEFSRGLFRAMDANNDGYIEPDELTSGVFDILDTNGNNQLAPDEWAVGEQNFYK
jgi:Ca2+-binding EF-hand superfamily protein